jgi:hypothetical protein
MSWWRQPFDSQGNVWDWALFIGLILVLIMLWARVIKMFEEIEIEVPKLAAEV